MKLAFIQTEIELTDPVILTTASGNYSIPYVAGLLQWLEKNGAIIENNNWKKDNYSSLVEKGIEVEFESVTFLFRCSYENFSIKRVKGNKVRFWGLCELFKDTEG